jgi:hypothetical protein
MAQPTGPIQGPARREQAPAPREYPRTFEPRTKNDVFNQIYETNPMDREFFKPNNAAGKNEYGMANALHGPEAQGGNSFQYPSDLGSQEYNHFVLFSVYQGKSMDLSSENMQAADDADSDWGNNYDYSVIPYAGAGSGQSQEVMAAESREADIRSHIENTNSRDSGMPGQDTTSYRAGGRGGARGQGARKNTVQQTRINPAKVRMMETVALYMPQKINQLGILDYDLEATTGAAIIKDLANLELKGLAGLGQGVMNMGTKFLDGVAEAFGVEDTGFNPALRASMRITSNPRRELVFNQPQPRKFEFNFEFAPRNQDETQLINEIIRVFKFHAYPFLQSNGYFYEMPAEFHVKYYQVTEDGATIENTFLNRIGACALTEVNVDYAAAGVASFHKDGSPTHVNLSLTFSEMEVLTQQHINEGF